MTQLASARGNRALARRRQPPKKIAKPLVPSGVRAGAPVLARMPKASDLMDRITPLFGGMLNHPTKGQMPQGHSLQEHLNRVLTAYERDIAASQTDPQRYAMVISALSSNVARVIAKDLNDPTLIPLISREIAQLYKEDLPEWLLGDSPDAAEAGHVRAGAGIAAQMAGSDVIERFLKSRVPLEAAVLEIRTAALKAGLKPSAMYDMLVQQHRLDMGAHSGSEVSAGFQATDPARAFDLTNLVGTVAPHYHAWVTSKVDPTGAAPGTDLVKLRDKVAEWDGANETLRAKLPDRLGHGGPSPTSRIAPRDTPVAPADAAPLPAPGTPLEAGVRDAKSRLHSRGAPPPGHEVSGASLSERQFRHIRAVEREESEGTRPADKLKEIATFVGKFPANAGDSEAELENKARQVIAGMENMELTIRVSGERMFGTDTAAIDPGEYKSSQQMSKRTQWIGDVLPGANKAPEGKRGFRYHEASAHERAQRGENYLRWRHDKDRRQTRFSGFDSDEWAKFAAVHASFKSTSGSTDPATFGDTVLVLNDAVKRRATYTYSTGAPERRSMAEVFCDLLSAHNAGQPAAGPILLTILRNTLGGGGEAAGFVSFHLEAHIYGRLDVRNDTKQILVDPEVPAATQRAIVAFAGSGIPVSRTR